MDRTTLIRKVHALAKEIWGATPIGGVPAYIFWTRLWAKLVYKVEQRRQLNDAQWLEMYEWLKKLKKEVDVNGEIKEG